LIRLSFQIDRIWWFPVGQGRGLTSTFISPNTAATYFGLSVLAATALLARSLSHTLQAGGAVAGANRREVFVNALTRSLGGLTVVWLLLLTVLLLTASRGGILASLSAVAVMLFLRTFRGRNKPGSLSRFLIGGGLLLALVAVIEVAGGKFLSRLFISGIKDIDRYYAMQAALTAASDHLLTGSGAGTFQSIFPLYRPASLDKTGFWSSAHSDYLDSLVGLGVPGFGALLFILATLAYRTLRGVMARRRDSHYALIALSATVLVGLHAFVDFSLQIQGVVTTYIALMGVGVAQSQSSQRG
jgi:O-antigen ligase